MALILMLVVPAVVGVWLVGSGRHLAPTQVARLAAAASSLALVIAVEVAITRPQVNARWVPALGLRWQFQIDGISAPLIILTAAVTFLAVLYSAGRVPLGGAPSTFFGCLLLVEFGALATFSAQDVLLFFIAFEIVLVPMWVLISRFGDPHDPRARADASARFILYTAFGSTLMLLGILLLIKDTGTADLQLMAVGNGEHLSATSETLAAALLVGGLAVKVPVFPLHTWLPPAHTTAPTAGSVLLAAVLLKMGTYGLVRLPIAALPEGFAKIAPFLGVAGAIGIIWGGLACLVERDLKRLIAYSSVAHMGFVAVGLASGTRTGLQAALFANIAHGIVSALLFFIVGGLKERWGNADLATARLALREVAPKLGFAFILGLAASLGLPGLAGFWGEILATYAAWSPAVGRPVGLMRAIAVTAAIGTVLATAYALRVARLVWVGDRPGPADDPSSTPDMVGVERAVVTSLTVAALFLGLLPGPLLALTSPAVDIIIGSR